MHVKSDTEYIAKTGHTIDIEGNIPLEMKQELVRCKDCKHWEVIETLIGPDCVCLAQGEMNVEKDAEDYCSWGERKTE